MPAIWMDVDTALAEVPVNVVPLIDDTDFKTREESVAYNQAGMDLVWNFVTSAGAYTQTAVTPTTAGDYDWTNQGNGMYSIEIPASGGASINNDTEGYGWFTGFATGILPWTGPIIGFRAAGLNDALCDSAYSTTRGLAGTALPAAAADAAGGLPISDAGGLDLDSKLANTNEVTAARMGALTDWIDGGRLDLILDAAATATALATAQSDLDILTGTDGVTLATSQPNYAPATAAALATVDSNVDTLLTRITSTLFSGITSLAEWLGMIAGKQSGDATALTEIRATGAGSGTFDPTTDSGEAVRDHVGDGTNLTEAGGDGDHLTEAGGTGDHLTALATAAALTTVDNEIAVIDGIVDNLNLGIIYGSAATGTLSITQATSDLTGYADDQLIGRVIIWTSGDAEGEATDITDYANTGGLLTFTALTTAPANGDTFKIV